MIQNQQLIGCVFKLFLSLSFPVLCWCRLCPQRESRVWG